MKSDKAQEQNKTTTTNLTKESNPVKMLFGKIPLDPKHIAILSVCAFLFICIAVSLFALLSSGKDPFQNSSNSSREISVPNLTGKTIEQAKTENPLFIIEQAGEEISLLPKGQICWQSAEPGSLLSSGLTIKVKISSGEKAVEIPDVTGQGQSEAIKKLESLGLKVSVVLIKESSIPKGNVSSTLPAAGETVAVESQIIVYVSDGQQVGGVFVKVPNVIGLPLTEATAALEELGLIAGNRKVYSDKPIDTVVAQSIAADDSAAQGMLIMLNISGGPYVAINIKVNIPMPETLNKSCSVDAYLNGESVYGQNINPFETGSIELSLSGHETVPLIVRIDGKDYMKYNVVFTSESPLVLNEECEEWLTILRNHTPNTVGMVEEIAVAKLKNLGFDVDVEYKITGASAGTVASQEILSATKAKLVIATI